MRYEVVFNCYFYLYTASLKLNFLLCSRIFFYFSARTFPDIRNTKDVVALIDLLFLLVLFSCCFFSDHSGGIVCSFVSQGVELIAAREVHGAEDAQEAEGDGRPPLRHLVMHQPKAAANAVRRWLQALRGHSVPRVRGQHNVRQHLR